MLLRLFYFSFILLLTSCGNHEESKIGQRSPISGADQVGGSDTREVQLPLTDLMFSDIYENVIGPNCMLCHSKRKYDDYEVVKKNMAKMLSHVLTNKMPVDFSDNPQPLPQHLKDMFEEWVNAGAPKFGSEAL